MKLTTVNSQEIKDTLNFSVEHWVSKSVISEVKVGNFCSISNNKSSIPTKLILDTNCANNGLLQLVRYAQDRTEAKSHRKIIESGEVAISRLRTYLRQVLCFSKDVCEELKVSSATVSSEFLVLKPKDCTCEFLSLLLLSESVQEHLKISTAGGHHPRISAEALFNAPISEDDIQKATSSESGFKKITRDYVSAQKKLMEL